MKSLAVVFGDAGLYEQTPYVRLKYRFDNAFLHSWATHLHHLPRLLHCFRQQADQGALNFLRCPAGCDFDTL